MPPQPAKGHLLHIPPQRIEALHVELATKLVVRESTAAVAAPMTG